MEERRKRRSVTKKEALGEVKNIALILLGCFLLAFADAVFIIPCQIVNGGVDSLSIIINFYVSKYTTFNVTDIVVGVVQLLLWLLGLAFLGKKFAFHSLLGSIAFPVFYSLMLRFDLLGAIGIQSMYASNIDSNTGNLSLAALMVAGLFGGILSGAGVACAYLGDGSTGGFDILSFIIAKHSEIKENVSGFFLDAALIIVGLICLQNWELALAGILSALVCAIAIQFIYIHGNSFVIVDIVSNKYDEIQEFIHKDMGHASTVIATMGGYTGEKRRMIRVVVYRMETNELRKFIAAVDPNAFVSFTEAKTINGQGFEPFVISSRRKKRILTRVSSRKRKEEAKKK